MAIRRSVDERIVVVGDRTQWLSKCKAALERAGFTQIDVAESLWQVSAKHKKTTCWGEIQVTLTPEDGNTALAIRATANVDNIYALFRSPTKTILAKFKSALQIA